ncbi:MAG TPA: serine hydrolase domain-containing protein [Anaerolineales bacterium]|nr:serine hydrolase domain-containing protein [Anaerolineales bacterium]
MKAYTFFTQWLCLLLAGITPFQRNILANNDKSDFETIDEYVTAQMRSARIPGLALAIVKGDQIVYLKGYGRADQSGRPVTPQTPFLIGSITKPFTALAVMQLVEAGKVELDAPVQRYIPWFRTADPKASAQITVRMLIDQTSGLPQGPTMVTWTWPDEADAIERHVRLLANTKLVFPPGQGFTYSNGNYVTLGMIVQAVSGQSYEDYIRQHIFTPLDMQHSYVSQEAAMQDGMARGYRWWLGFPIPVTLPDNRANLPAGFAISSAEDMAHFLIAQMNGGRYRNSSVLSPEEIALMQAEPPPGTYSLGWESVRIDGRRLINFDGATGNYQASLFIDPEAQVGVFVAANAMSALDGLSSSRSTASLGARSVPEIVRRLLSGDKDITILFSALITTRGMAHSVLNIATDRTMPSQGLGQRRVALIVDLVILVLTGALILSLVRIPEWYGLLAQHGIPNWSDLAWRIGPIAILHFAWPLALLYVVLKVPSWIMLVLYQPDLVIWLESVAAVVSLKGLLEIALAWQVFWQIH